MPGPAIDLLVPLLTRFEGLHEVRSDGMIHPYRDPVGFPTIGYGTLLSLDRDAPLDTWPPITRSLAEEMMLEEVASIFDRVVRLVKVPVNDAQIAALVDFAYNLGTGALRASTLLRMLNRGDYEEAADQFLRWNKAGGRILRGLTLRRMAERDLFLQGM